jgi:predicted NUDIX family NTP pyrophosphohydrolase
VKKFSAGILVYKDKGDQIEVLLAHPGGPFWAKKDSGAWSIPKGECEENEDLLDAAKREFKEEIGQEAPNEDYLDLGEFKRKDGKTITAWAVKGDLDVNQLKSNTFEMEWPPHSGKKQEFPEIDKAEWFSLDRASEKLHSGQAVFLERLAEKLKLEKPGAKQQLLL